MALLPFLAWDDFDTYTIGTNVAGHTLRGGGAPTYKPQYSTTAILPYKRRYLEFLTDATTDYHCISRDACDGLRDFDRVFGFAMSLCTVEELHLYARGAGTGTMTDFVRASIVLATGAIRIDKMIASAYTAGSGGSAGTVTLTAGRAYLGRFNGNGATVSLKIWDASLGMAGEPTAFDLAPAGMPTASGWHGFGGKHTTLTGKVAAFNFDAFSNTAAAAVCPRTNAERTAWLAKQDQLRIVVAKMRATGYDSAGSPYTKAVWAYIANHGYTSAAQDTPSLQHFDACITGVPAISREMPAALSGQAQVSIGRMKVGNPAGGEVRYQNLFLQSSIFDNAAWSGSITPTPNTATPPTGRVRADTLTDSSGAVFMSRWQSITVPNDSATYRVAICVKKTTGGTSTTFGLNLSLTGGSAVTAGPRINTDTGIDLAGVATIQSTPDGGYWLVICPLVNNASGNTTLLADIFPATAAYNTLTDAAATTGSAIVSGMWGYRAAGAQYAETTSAAADRTAAAGLRDDWLRVHWLRDGFELILLGQGWPLHDGMHLIRGRLGNPVATDLKTLEFPIADMSEALNVPLTTQKFSSGDLNGLYKPVLIGYFDTAATGQFEPPEMSSQVFQISDTALQSTANVVGNVLDNQVQLTGTTGLTHTSADTGTEIITVSASHGAGVDSRVVYTAGTPPAPLVVGTTYWIKTAPGAATFTLAATRGGATINLTTAGTAGSPLTIYNYWFDEAAATMTLIFARTPGGRITVCEVSDDGNTSQIHTAYTNILTRAGLNANYVGPGFTAAAFDACNPALWFDSNPHTCAEAMARLAKGSLSWYGFAADGPLGGGSVTVPAATAVVSLDRSDIADVRHESTRRATDFSVAQRSCGAWYLTGGPLNVGTIYARQQKIIIAQVAATTGVPIDDHAQVTDADKASEFSYDALTSVPGATSYDLYRYNLGIFSITTAKLTPLECTVGDTVSIDFPRLGFKQWNSGDPASPDNTATIDSRLAVVVGHYLKPNKAGNSYSHVDLKVFRRIPGYYPTANLN